jgi:hypothetical protein
MWWQMEGTQNALGLNLVCHSTPKDEAGSYLEICDQNSEKLEENLRTYEYHK